MNNKDALNIELAKKYAEEQVIIHELETSKKQFIEYMKNNFNEVNVNDVSKYNVPVRYHKPFKLRIREFLNKLGKVLGF